MNQEQQRVIDATVKASVRQVFAIMGVDIDVPKDVEEFRENLRFSASMRHAVNKGVLAVVALMAVGIAGAMWAGIVATISKGTH